MTADRLVERREAAVLPAAAIHSVETHIVDIPLRRPHKLSRAVLVHQSYLLIRISTQDGVVGIGEATVPGGPWWSGESVEAMQALFSNEIAPSLQGRDIFTSNAILAEIDRIVYGNAALKSAIETALLDAVARTLGIPLSSLFGGRLADELPVLWVLATGELEADIEEAKDKLAQKLHRRFKIKVGRAEPDIDARRAAMTADAVGCPCSIDLNEAWSLADSARALAILEGSGVDILEQPLPRADIAGLADLARRSSVAIMADESACAQSDLTAIIRERAASYISLKISKSGGPSRMLAIARAAQAAGINLFGGTALDSSIGTAANLQCCATLSLAGGTELFMPLLLADDIIEEPLQYRDFSVAVPIGPGIGVTIDEDKLRHYARE
ncbi:muconate/chloromuconate family cycloisomerase (plasmid) [Sphingopyxis indica]|uniref:muconate/chloromuconate family cycloisomerase n=1 Tax=Sphingopyxis indica TaxID=436663 RepID=UPI0029394A31|nr:muconate/chloromuconate family cycloisomerase [Sphingopyxis indica]WOF45881.1 muconate/chloromuconate family cycloisomerase [Sphingopyxis indica]